MLIVINKFSLNKITQDKILKILLYQVIIIFFININSLLILISIWLIDQIILILILQCICHEIYIKKLLKFTNKNDI